MKILLPVMKQLIFAMQGKFIRSWRKWWCVLHPWFHKYLRFSPSNWYWSSDTQSWSKCAVSFLSWGFYLSWLHKCEVCRKKAAVCTGATIFHSQTKVSQHICFARIQCSHPAHCHNTSLGKFKPCHGCLWTRAVCVWCLERWWFAVLQYRLW